MYLLLHMACGEAGQEWPLETVNAFTVSRISRLEKILCSPLKCQVVQDAAV